MIPEVEGTEERDGVYSVYCLNKGSASPSAFGHESQATPRLVLVPAGPANDLVPHIRCVGTRTIDEIRPPRVKPPKTQEE